MNPRWNDPGMQLHRQLLEPDETIEVEAETPNVKLLVTDRRVAVATDDRVALDVAYTGVRRIEFDIERHRPVIVPEHPSHEPQVIGIPVDSYDQVTRALAVVGRRLAEAG
jgi:hypothetical protein